MNRTKGTGVIGPVGMFVFLFPGFLMFIFIMIIDHNTEGLNLHFPFLTMQCLHK